MKAVWVDDDLDIDYNTLEILDGAFSKVFTPSNRPDDISIYKAMNRFNPRLLNWMMNRQ